MARNWYSYNGAGDILLPSSYNLATVKPACINGPNICAVYAPGATTPSAFSNRMKTYISNLNLALTAQPDTNLAIKKYAYGKN